MDFKTLISHRFRGFSDYENSIAGLKAALDFGVQKIEFDIRFSKCGTPMIYHDETAIDKDGKLQHLYQIKASNFKSLGGTFTHIPKAEDLFAAIAAHTNKTCQLLIDVKDAGFEPALYALVRSYRLEQRIVWVSWLPEVLYAFNDIEAKQSLCLSHWCRRPGRRTRAIHHMFSADNGHIPRPKRRYVIGERSGWFVDGPVRGDIRRILTHICVPAGQVWPDLVSQYQEDNIKVSAFSYTDEMIIESEARRLKLDDYFIDNKTLFERYKA